MRKITMLFVCCVLLSQVSMAQVRFGGKAGLNLSNMKVKVQDSTAETKSLAGFHVGAILDFAVSEQFSVQPQLLISTKGYQFKEEGDIMGLTFSYESKAAPLYVEIPVNCLFKADLGFGKLFIGGGPYLGFGVGGNFKLKTTVMGLSADTTAKINWGNGEDDDMKPLDYGVNVTGGLEIKGFLIGLNYSLGLANIHPKGDSDHIIKNSSLGLSVGYLIGDQGSGKKKSKRRR